MSSGAPQVAAADRPSHQVMYQLGPYKLSRLEERVGEEVFAEFIRRYMVHDVRTTEDLLCQPRGWMVFDPESPVLIVPHELGYDQVVRYRLIPSR